MLVYAATPWVRVFVSVSGSSVCSQKKMKMQQVKLLLFFLLQLQKAQMLNRTYQEIYSLFLHTFFPKLCGYYVSLKVKLKNIMATRLTQCH